MIELMRELIKKKLVDGYPWWLFRHHGCLKRHQINNALKKSIRSLFADRQISAREGRQMRQKDDY